MLCLWLKERREKMKGRCQVPGSVLRNCKPYLSNQGEQAPREIQGRAWGEGRLWIQNINIIETRTGSFSNMWVRGKRCQRLPKGHWIPALRNGHWTPVQGWGQQPWAGASWSLLVLWLWTSLEATLSLRVCSYKSGAKHIYFGEISTVFGRASVQ